MKKNKDHVLWYDVEENTMRGPRLRPVHIACYHDSQQPANKWRGLLIERLYYEFSPDRPQCAICLKPIG
jgi:hypothetical protein